MLEKKLYSIEDLETLKRWRNNRLSGRYSSARISWCMAFQIRFDSVIVDGVEYREDVVTWTISGIEYTVEEMKTLGRVMWPLNETAILTVKKPGGLEQGEHEVQVITGHIASYIPPRMDTMYIEMAKRRPNTRKLIIV